MKFLKGNDVVNDTNKHGLKRTIPSSVKRIVRQNSKFGCVKCRLAIFEYEHIDPTFTDAKQHDPDKICLLCPNCHRDVTSGVTLKKEIEAAYQNIRSDPDADRPFRKNFFNFKTRSLKICIGPTIFENYHSIINVDGRNYLSFNNSVDDPLGCVMDAFFLDENGNELFRVEGNEWIGNSQNWDVDIVGRKLTIRRKVGDILFCAETFPEENKLEITHLNMWIEPFHILIKNGLLNVGQYDEVNKTYIYFGVDAHFKGGECALSLNSGIHSKLKFSQLEWIGGEGAKLGGTGICIGYKSATAIIHKIEINNL